MDQHERTGVRRILLWLLGLSVVAAPSTYAAAPVRPGDVVVGFHVLALAAVWVALWRELVDIPTVGVLTIAGSSIGAVATTAATAGAVGAGDLDSARLAIVVMPSLITVAGLAMATMPRRSQAAAAIGLPAVAHVVAVLATGGPSVLGAAPVVVALRYSLVATILFAIVAWIAEGRASARDVARRRARRLADQQATREQVWRDAAHELRTPLSILVMSHEALDAHGDALGEEDRTRLEAAARRAVAQLAERIDRVGTTPPDPAPTTTRTTARTDVAVDDALDDLAPMLGGRDLRRRLEPATTTAPPDALRHVVENLLANAVKYGPDGTPIEVVLEARDTHAVLRVHDAGRALAGDDLDRVFERGYRTPEAEQTAPGDGLGLALVQRLVEDWGGEVGCEVDVDGTVFWCRLPVASRSEGQTGSAAVAHEAH